MIRVGVVGAGLGGLSTAIRLAHDGFKVDLYEQQSFTGGKAGELNLDGFRFDTGPSLLTMAAVFQQLFEDVGAQMDEYVRLERLDPLCHYFFADGSRLKSYSNARRFAEEIGSKTRDSAAQVEAFMAYSRRIHDAAVGLFLHKSLHEIATYTRWETVKSLLHIGRIDPLRSLARANSSFFKDPRTRQIFNRYATYNGSDPFRMPATFNLIPHVESLGGYALHGGIAALPAGMTRLAREQGVRIYTDSRVQSIRVDQGRVRGLITDNTEKPYDVVVSNADVLSTYGQLLDSPQSRWARRYKQFEPSSSALVFYWGLNRRFSDLGVHNIFFSPDYRREFDDIFARGICPEEPTVYINITSKVDPADAPPGGENWFVMVNVPPHTGQDWADLSRQLRQRILQRIEAVLGDVGPHIAVESMLTPADIEARTGSTYGSLYGLASNSRLAAFRRHPNRSRRFKGLYFCGGSAHPGGGMPLAVLSGKITADLVKRYER